MTIVEMASLVDLGDELGYHLTPSEADALLVGFPAERFRRSVQVADGTVQETGSGVKIVVADRDCPINMVHTEAAPELLGESIGFVVEGSWAGDHLESSTLIVNHDEEYRSAENGYIPRPAPRAIGAA